jgi:hypothetical protein
VRNNLPRFVYRDRDRVTGGERLSQRFVEQVVKMDSFGCAAFHSRALVSFSQPLRSRLRTVSTSEWLLTEIDRLMTVDGDPPRLVFRQHLCLQRFGLSDEPFRWQKGHNP